MTSNPLDITGILSIATKIDTPLMLAGLAVLILFLLYRKNLSPLQATFVFVLALVSIILGVSAWVYEKSILHDNSLIVDGRVYSPPTDLTAGVGTATVHLIIHGDPPREAVTRNEDGSYEFPIKTTSGSDEAQMWVTAPGYHNSEMKVLKLSSIKTTVDFGLVASPRPSAPLPPPVQQNAQSNPPNAQPVQPEKGLTESPSCLNGQWREHLVGTPDTSQMSTWTFSVDGDNLTASRADKFVSGSFTKSGADWRGDLKWGNGETWHNVLLTPTSDCRLMSTNQGWTYGR